MGLGNKDIFTPAKSFRSDQIASVKPEIREQKNSFKRQTYHLRMDLEEKVKSYAYWERLKISEVVNLALDNFFKERKIQIRK